MTANVKVLGAMVDFPVCLPEGEYKTVNTPQKLKRGYCSINHFTRC